ncbi:sulfatase-like hydrolase/transferase [Salinirubrum litoreum]|uniref:Sulfatase-like hydrolase/transferase n=1 Tax=Salinirubrum litoreum TaxID=1126234 RepID=A0ABD5RFK8_9EURY|nr:sulfatase-like hydrolase/transferase [Salinirubrum litoreum]
MSRNVALIVLDTLRYDAFESEFGFLDGVTFTNCYSPSHWTIPAHASLFTGYSPSEVQAHAKSTALDTPNSTLAEALSAAGYRTRMWTTNVQLNINPGWRRGFDELRGPQNLDPAADDLFNWTEALADIDATGLRKYARAGLECLRSDAATVPSMFDMARRHVTERHTENDSPKVRRRLAETSFGDGNEFLYVNLMEAHTPYWSGQDFGLDEPVDVVVSQSFLPETIDRDRIVDAYGEVVQYLASEYERLFTSLTEQFDCVITVADHGEMLGEGGWWNHGYGLFPELVHVPCHVWYDGVSDRTVDRPVSLLDVPATVAEFTDIQPLGRGYDLLGEDAPNDRAVVTEYHGVLPWLFDQAESYGVDTTEYERRDTPLFGIADADGYRFQRHGRTDELTDTDRDRLDEKVDIRSIDLEHKQTDVSDDAISRLEHLGYA